MRRFLNSSASSQSESVRTPSQPGGTAGRAPTASTTAAAVAVDVRPAVSTRVTSRPATAVARTPVNQVAASLGNWSRRSAGWLRERSSFESGGRSYGGSFPATVTSPSNPSERRAATSAVAASPPPITRMPGIAGGGDKGCSIRPTLV